MPRLTSLLRRSSEPRRPRYLPHVLPLEDRLPLGDGLLGVLTSLALLPAHAAPAVIAAPGTATPVGRISNPSTHTDGLEIRPTESRAAASGSEAPAALPAAVVAPVLPAVPVVPAVPVEVDAPESAPVRSKVKKAKGEHDREDVSTHPA